MQDTGDSTYPSGVSGRVTRHKLPDRIYHWSMAASVLTLLGTSFLPILGIKFSWVAPHWIAGLVLTVLVAFHIVRATIWLEFRSMLVGIRDVINSWRAMRRMLLLPGKAPDKPGKYPLLNRLYHHGAATVVLITIGTGLLMMIKVDTPLWTRDPYFFTDQIWGVVYSLHGISSLCLVALIMMHIYFGVRPEKLWITRSMILGWITRKEYLEEHDTEAWVVSDAPEAEGKSHSAEAQATAKT